MRIALTLLLGIHALIHLFGFLKAFGISEFKALRQPIPKSFGIAWCIAFLLFVTTMLSIVLDYEHWWGICFVAILVSQILIIRNWTDAKFGTIINGILLVASIIGYSQYSFQQKIEQEKIALLTNTAQENIENLTHQDIADLPEVVQKWLTKSGAIGKPKVSTIHLSQALKLKLKPEQKEWNLGTAEQYFTTSPPAFHWNIKTEMNPLLSVVGRDKFVNGKGEMLIQLLSLIPVAKAEDNVKVNEASLQRYLAEIVWFPSADLNQYIEWEAIDDHSAKATLTYNGTKGTGTFYFDENGLFEKFVCLRYKDQKDEIPTQWTVTATKTEERNGIKIPIECEASWQLNDQEWTWLKLKITDIDYNQDNEENKP